MDDRIRAATRLWTLVQPQVSAFILSLVHDFAVRDDILQETAVAVLESFDNYAPERPFIAWALGIARNQTRMYQRKRARDRLQFDDTVVDQLSAAFEAADEDDMRSLSFLNDCLSKLDGRSRQLCDLRYMHDLKPAAIAAKLSMSANAVSKALQRIRENLEACMQRQLLARKGAS